MHSYHSSIECEPCAASYLLEQSLQHRKSDATAARELRCVLLRVRCVRRGAILCSVFDGCRPAISARLVTVPLTLTLLLALSLSLSCACDCSVLC